MHSISRHMVEEHPEEPNPISIMPIDYMDVSTHNRLQTLKRMETYWMFKLKTLWPQGLNDITEIIT